MFKKRTIIPQEDAKRTLRFEKSKITQPSPFKSNFIKTSKYNLVTFLPKAILMQFSRYANIYFLVTAIVQCVPKISPLSPVSAVAPFVFVIALSVIREGYEDLQRHKSDKEMNALPCEIYRSDRFERAQWAHIQVGDIVRVKDNDFLPADMILLNSKNELGVAYMETSSLDGEKNLKPRQCYNETIIVTTDGTISKECAGTVTCDGPNAMLYKFEGFFQLDKGQKLVLGPKNLLFRGSKLKNTEWLIGVVVYTGDDTKVMKNAETSHTKISNVEKTANHGILGILLVNLLFCLICATSNFVWDSLFLDGHRQNHYVYLDKRDSHGVEAIISFFAYFLLLNTLIPISLIVTLEFVKLFQSFFIKKDQDMYNAEKDRYAKVSTTSIIEELGQVEYIFTDKTGTLTCNKMEFKLCMIGNKLYGDKRVLKGGTSEKSKPIEAVDQVEGVEYTFDDRSLKLDLTGEADVNMNVQLYGTDEPIKSHKHLMQEFMKCLALCHDCLAQKDDADNFHYQGPSPDEVTLVDFAKRNDYVFKGTQYGVRIVDVLGEEQRFELLQLFEFDSDRKRMGVIVREASGVIKLYVKGADTVIKHRLSKDIHQKFLPKIDAYVEDFSLRGLRTLLVAMRVISEDEYQDIAQKINATIEATNRDDKIKEVAEGIERNLTIIGATAVEDKLQDNVPETIHDLLRANLKVWMLTGDKLETAENIGRSCNLILPNFASLKISEKTPEDVEASLKAASTKFCELYAKQQPKVLLIEGEALAIVFESAGLKKGFYEIARHCESVICCRVNPKQKADVVRLIRNNMHKITLAIGDGANDVNMIQAAHIGIGLYGEEGMRAAQAGDFAIPEFKDLWRLLFVHGRWSYIRISEMILYFFYKNIVFTLPQFFFAFVCAYSGQTIFDDWYISLFNTIFTLLPVVARACFDQDVYYKRVTYETKDGKKVVNITELSNVKKSYPLLYSVGMENKIFNTRTFWASVAKGSLHSVLLFVLTFFSLKYAILNNEGQPFDMWYFSITLFTSIILVVDIKLAIYTRYWTAIMWFCLLVTSLGVYLGYIWITNYMDIFLIWCTVEMLFSTPHFYLIVLLNTGCIFFIEAMYIYLKREYYTETTDFITSLVKSKQENNETKFDRVEENLIEYRKKRLAYLQKKRARMEGSQSKKKSKSLSEFPTSMTISSIKKEPTTIDRLSSPEKLMKSSFNMKETFTPIDSFTPKDSSPNANSGENFQPEDLKVGDQDYVPGIHQALTIKEETIYIVNGTYRKTEPVSVVISRKASTDSRPTPKQNEIDIP